MTSNTDIAKAMAENMTHAAVPLYGKKLRLPDRGAIIGIIKEFRCLLFPAYFGDPQLMALPAENYAELLLERIETALAAQVALALPEDQAFAAGALTHEILEQLPRIQQTERPLIGYDAGRDAGNRDARRLKALIHHGICANSNIICNTDSAKQLCTGRNIHPIADDRRGCTLTCLRSDVHANMQSTVFTDASGTVDNNRPRMCDTEPLAEHMQRDRKTKALSAAAVNQVAELDIWLLP